MHIQSSGLGTRLHQWTWFQRNQTPRLLINSAYIIFIKTVAPSETSVCGGLLIFFCCWFFFPLREVHVECGLQSLAWMMFFLVMGISERTRGILSVRSWFVLECFSWAFRKYCIRIFFRYFVFIICRLICHSTVDQMAPSFIPTTSAESAQSLCTSFLLPTVTD